MTNSTSSTSELLIIDNEYSKLQVNENPYVKAQVLYNIIQIKAQDAGSSVRNYNQTLYLDIKHFLRFYLDSVDGLAYGYDAIDTAKIFALYKHLRAQESMALNSYAIRLLKSSGFDREASQCKRQINQLKFLKAQQEQELTMFLAFLLYKASASFKSIMVSGLVLLVVFTLLLLPAPQWMPAIFTIQYDDYNTNFLINHVLNLLAGSVGIGEHFKISALNAWGLIMMVIGKIIIVVLIGNFILQELIQELTD